MNINAWKYYGKFYRDFYGKLVLNIIVSVVQSLLVLPIAFFVRYAFNVIMPGGDFHILILIGLAIFLLHLLNNGIGLWMRHTTNKITKTATCRFREELIKKCYGLPHTYFNNADTSTLHFIIVNNTEHVDNMSKALIVQMLPALIISTILSVFLLYLNWVLFVLLTAIAPALFMVNKSLGESVEQQTFTFQQSFKTFHKGILFVLQNMDLTKVQTAEESEIKRQRSILKSLYRSSWKMNWLSDAYRTLNNTMVVTIGVIILIVGGINVINQSMSLGDLIAFYVAVGLLKNYLGILFTAIPKIIIGKISLVTLVELAKVKDKEPYSGKRQIPFRGKIALEGVCFGYQNRQVLNDINLTIQPGETVAIIGPTGVGKTTIANLILGYYRPHKGRIYADDQPFDELDLLHIRKHIGVVRQNPIIFPGTILENIVYGSPNKSIEHVKYAAELATANLFINKLPKNYNTFVGEGGTLVSGGEHQSIVIARALLRRPKLLILDEPTTHLDEDAIRQLIKNLKGLNQDTSILIISHDINIVQETNRVYELHEECIKTNGNYITLLTEDNI